MIRWLLILLSAGLVLGLSVGAWIWSDYQRFLEQPLHTFTEHKQTFVLERGMHYADMVEQLHSIGYTNVTWHWRLLGRLKQPILKAGEYRIAANTTPEQWLDQLQSGDVVLHQFTIVEGWNSRELLAQLATEPLLAHASESMSVEQILDSISTPQTTELLAGLVRSDEVPDYGLLEGLFLPETYNFQRGESDLLFLKRAHQALLKQVQTAWEQVDNDNLPLEHPYQLLTLASIIEKETGVVSEREQIAGVFARRLQRGMKLQTDPTVIYGLGDQYDGNIRRRDLQTDTIYNTYTRTGLPPTPIALAGAAAIQATARPAEGNSLYFVASGNGGHVFSATLREHNQAVQRYLQKQRARRQQGGDD